MNGDQRVELGCPGQECGDIGGRDALQGSAIPRVITGTGFRRQQKGIQELFAELPVAEPDLAYLVGNQRQVVDEERSWSEELNVVRGCIGQRESVIERLCMEIERQQRGRPEAIDRTVEGILNER